MENDKFKQKTFSTLRIIHEESNIYQAKVFFSQAIDILGNQTKAIELFMLRQDKKPCIRLLIKTNSSESVKQWLENLGYAVTLYPHKLMTDQSISYSTKGFILTSEKSTTIDSSKIDINSSGGYYNVDNSKDIKEDHIYSIFYVSKDKDKCLFAQQAEINNNHDLLGNILGYPKCCRSFFDNNLESENKGHNDFVVPSINSSQNFEVNVFLRYFDLPIIFHAPCSFCCKESEKIACSIMEELFFFDFDLYSDIYFWKKSLVLFVDDEKSKDVILIKPTIFGRLPDNKVDLSGNIHPKELIFQLMIDKMISSNNSPFFQILKKSCIKKSPILLHNESEKKNIFSIQHPKYDEKKYLEAELYNMQFFLLNFNN